MRAYLRGPPERPLVSPSADANWRALIVCAFTFLRVTSASRPGADRTGRVRRPQCARCHGIDGSGGYGPSLLRPTFVRIGHRRPARHGEQWAPVWFAPPMPGDGRRTTTVTFDVPGTYILRARADRGRLESA